MSMIEKNREKAQREIRHVQEETLSNELPDELPPRPNHGRTLGIIGAICLVVLVVLAFAQYA